MEWITAFVLALIALGALATAREAGKIRSLLAETRPLPWTALAEIRERVAAGDLSAIQAVEELIAQRGSATVGDWLADGACAQILDSLFGPSSQPNTQKRPPAEANGRQQLPGDELPLTAPTPISAVSPSPQG